MSEPTSDGLRITAGTEGRTINKWHPDVNITLGVDTMVLLGCVAWAAWERWFRPQLLAKMTSVWQPMEEERRLTNILAQLTVLAGADRAILTAFHNGVVDNHGYHLQRMTTINQFVDDGAEAMPYPIKDLPIGRIMIEIEQMLETGTWTVIKREPGQPPLCRAHLERNGVHYMANRLVMIGNLPIGIVSVQYISPRAKYFVCETNTQRQVTEALYQQVCEIMKRRVVKPSPFTRMRLFMARVFELRSAARGR